jgi:hypothetical protein
MAGDAEAGTVPAVDLVIGRASWFMRRRTEASIPLQATSSSGGRRAEAGSEGSACAPVAGWGRQLRTFAPGPHHPA